MDDIRLKHMQDDVSQMKMNLSNVGNIISTLARDCEQRYLAIMKSFSELKGEKFSGRGATGSTAPKFVSATMIDPFALSHLKVENLRLMRLLDEMSKVKMNISHIENNLSTLAKECELKDHHILNTLSELKECRSVATTATATAVPSTSSTTISSLSLTRLQMETSVGPLDVGIRGSSSSHNLRVNPTAATMFRVVLSINTLI